MPTAVIRTSQRRRVETRRTSAGMLPVLGALAGASALGQIELPAPVLSEGFFSAAQVNRGERAFLRECTDCHEMAEFTAAGAFLDEQQGETVWSIFEFIWSEMPEDRPAWLEPSEYADILAYILSVYGFPSGATDMPIDRDALDDVTIEPPPGPRS